MRIITDSSAEFDQQEAKALNIQIVPLTVIFGGQAYLEGQDMPKDEFYEKLKSEFPHTSLPSAEEFKEEYLRCEGEETLVILISSALSGTVNAARLAAQEFGNVRVYDSLCCTAMLRILVETAVKNRERGVEEVVNILDGLRPRIRLYACLDTLEFLYKGGRIKKSVAIVGGLLGIKPYITIPKEGTVVQAGRAHGQKKALKMLSDALKTADIDENYPVYFLQTDVDTPARAVMKEVGRENDRIFRICCSVGSHIGPNAAGVVYVEK